MKKIFIAITLSAVFLTACNSESTDDDVFSVDEQIENNAEENNEEEYIGSWQDVIKSLAVNEAKPADKFYALEKYMANHKPTQEEFEQFVTDILTDYRSGEYLSDIGNHERMLTNIFKSYMVEKYTTLQPLADFAFDYYQNMKYTYRGVDAVDSQAVLSNEHQMNKALLEMEFMYSLYSEN